MRHIFALMTDAVDGGPYSPPSIRASRLPRLSKEKGEGCYLRRVSVGKRHESPQQLVAVLSNLAFGMHILQGLMTRIPN